MPGSELEDGAPSGGEGGVSFRGVVASRGMHRDQPGDRQPGGGAVLQQAGNGGTVDQGEQAGPSRSVLSDLSCWNEPSFTHPPAVAPQSASPGSRDPGVLKMSSKLRCFRSHNRLLLTYTAELVHNLATAISKRRILDYYPIGVAGVAAVGGAPAKGQQKLASSF